MQQVSIQPWVGGGGGWSQKAGPRATKASARLEDKALHVGCPSWACWKAGVPGDMPRRLEGLVQ